MPNFYSGAILTKIKVSTKASDVILKFPMSMGGCPASPADM